MKLTRPSVYYESKRRYTVHFGFFVGLFLISTSLAGFVNHHFTDKIKICRKYIIERKSTSSGRSTEYFFYLKTDNNNEERFSVGETRYENYNEGEEIELCMLKGKFGFNFAKEFNKVKK